MPELLNPAGKALTRDVLVAQSCWLGSETIDIKYFGELCVWRRYLHQQMFNVCINVSIFQCLHATGIVSGAACSSIS